MRILHWDAINPLTGRPYTWDDPNLRWGDPSYALEPGDPGFVPYPDQLPTEPKPKHRRMKHNDWYPVRQNDQIAWLQNFVAKLPGLAGLLGVSAATAAARIADARWIIYALGTWLPATRAWQQACTQGMQAVLFGTGSTAVLPVFDPPPLPGATGPDPTDLPAVTAQTEGALDRIFDFINGLQATAPMAAKEDLRMIGPEQTGPDFDTFGPKLKVKKTATGIELGWGWQGFGDFLDQCEIEVDRGNGWTLLTYDTTPGYTDTEPFPAQLTKWKYRAIYRVDDQRIGQWSAVVEVTVGG